MPYPVANLSGGVLGQKREECASFKDHLDKAAAELASLNQQIQAAAAAGNTAEVNRVFSQVLGARRRWENEKYWYDLCVRYGELTVTWSGFTFDPELPPPRPPKPPPSCPLTPEPTGSTGSLRGSRGIGAYGGNGDRIPTWAYVAGGVALAGIVAYAAVRG